MIADTPEELHEMAIAIGHRIAWFQASPPASTPHYDLTGPKRIKAVRLGAIELGRKEFVDKIRELRQSNVS